MIKTYILEAKRIIISNRMISIFLLTEKLTSKSESSRPYDCFFFVFFFLRVIFLIIERANYDFLFFWSVNYKFLIEEGIITDIIAWLRTNQIRVIFSTT